MHERLGSLIAPLVLSALLAACFARLLAEPGALLVDPDRPSVDDVQRVDDRAVGNDVTRLFLPNALRIADQVARWGRPSMWDPFGFGGRPRVGNPQAGLWYPPAWLVWWSGAPAAPGWLTVAHLLWAGLGTYVLARAQGVSRWGAAVAGGCFQAAPYLLAQTFEGHYPHVWAASWYPWAFWAMILMRRGDSMGTLALPPILAMALLVGHPQEWYYLALALGIWALADAWVAAREGRRGVAFSRLAIWAAISALTLGLAAVELVPVLQARVWMPRGTQIALKHASHYHLNPLNLMQLLSTGALGGPADHFGHDNYWETVLSFGWVPLVLAVLALRRSPRRRVVRGWAILAGVALVFAAGHRLGLFAVFHAVVPGVDLFRVPARSLFLASLGVAVLAGLGIDALGHPSADPEGAWDSGERRYRRLLVLIMVGLLLGHVAGRRRAAAGRPIVWPTAHSDARHSAEGRPSELSRWILAASRVSTRPTTWLFLGGPALAFAWLRRRPGERRRVAVAIGVLALVELGIEGHALLRVAPPSRFLGPDPVTAAMARLGLPGAYRIRARDAFYGDLRAVRHGLDKTNINDFFQIRHAADLYEQLYRLFEPSAPVDPLGRRRSLGRLPSRRIVQAVLDRMGVALLITDRPMPEAPWPVVASGHWEGSPYTIYRNPTVLPRAYVVPRGEPDADDGWSVVRFPTIDPRRAVLLAADPLGSGGPRQPFTPADYDATDPDRVRIQVETQAPGLLVVTDTWMPGWTASVDGRPAPVLRGDHAHRVVPLDGPGRHQVLLSYRPPGLVTGLLITAGSGLVWFMALASMAVPVFFRMRSSSGSRPPAWPIPDGPDPAVGECPSATPSHAASAATTRPSRAPRTAGRSTSCPRSFAPTG